MTKHFAFLALTLLFCAAAAAQPSQTQVAAKLSHIPASLSKTHCQGEYAYRTSPKTVSLDVMTFAGILQTDAAKMYPKHSDITVSSDFND